MAAPVASQQLLSAELCVATWVADPPVKSVPVCLVSVPVSLAHPFHMPHMSIFGNRPAPVTSRGIKLREIHDSNLGVSLSQHKEPWLPSYSKGDGVSALYRSVLFARNLDGVTWCEDSTRQVAAAAPGVGAVERWRQRWRR